MVAVCSVIRSAKPDCTAYSAIVSCLFNKNEAMRKIQETDSRKDAIRKFDDSMNELFDKTASFVDEIKRINISDENKIKIYTLGLNYSYDVIAIAQNVVAYSSYIKNSLLSIRYEVHKDYLDRIKVELNEIRQMSLNIVHSYAIGVEDELDEVKEKYKSGFHKDFEVVSGNAVVQYGNYNALNWQICNSFSVSGYTCYEEVLKGLSTIETTLTDLIYINHKRNDNDYEVLYNNAMDEFYSSNEWTNIQKGYINGLYAHKFKIKAPTQESVYELMAELEYSLSEDKKIGFLWEANKDNITALSKEIVKKEFDDDVNMTYLFEHLGKIKILEDWSWDLYIESTPIEEIVNVPDEYEVVTNAVTFINNFSEDELRKVWDDIYNYMEVNKDSAYAWCCLHHIMTCYHLIERTSFSIFMKWLNGFARKTLISESNIRQCATDYFVSNVNVKWDMEEMKKYINKQNNPKVNFSKQKQAKFLKYHEICVGLIEIFRNKNK